MKRSLITITFIGLIYVFLLFLPPPKFGLLLGFAITFSIALLFFGVIKIIHKMIYPKDIKENDSIKASQGKTSLTNRTMVIVMLVTASIEIIILGSFPKIIGEITHYFVLVLLGIILAKKWAVETNEVIFMTLLITLFIATIFVTIFIANPSVQFRFGPEAILFAFSNWVRAINMLPLDLVIVWGSWRIMKDLIIRKYSQGQTIA